MRPLVKFPLFLALVWGSFAHAGLAQTGIECGGKSWLATEGFQAEWGYLSIRLVPVGRFYDLQVDRVSWGQKVNIKDTPLRGLSCVFQETPVLRASCVGGTPENPQKFEVNERVATYETFKKVDYQLEAQASGVIGLKEQRFDGEDMFPASNQISERNQIRLLLSGDFGCGAFQPDPYQGGRWVGLSANK